MECRITPAVLNQISMVAILLASLAIVYLSVQPPIRCIPPPQLPPPPSLKLPKSSCESNKREFTTPDKKTKKLYSTKSWRKQVDSFTQLFQNLRNQGLFTNHSRVLCVSAGAGHEVMALTEIGVNDVTGVELMDSPPLVSRADPHNLPFFDDVFDLGFSTHLDESLFPSRFVSEIERTVKPDGVSVLTVEPRADTELEKILVLFERSSLFGVSNVTLNGVQVTQIIMRIQRPV